MKTVWVNATRWRESQDVVCCCMRRPAQSLLTSGAHVAVVSGLLRKSDISRVEVRTPADFRVQS